MGFIQVTNDSPYTSKNHFSFLPRFNRSKKTVDDTVNLLAESIQGNTEGSVTHNTRHFSNIRSHTPGFVTKYPTQALSILKTTLTSRPVILGNIGTTAGTATAAIAALSFAVPSLLLGPFTMGEIWIPTVVSYASSVIIGAATGAITGTAVGSLAAMIKKIAPHTIGTKFKVLIPAVIAASIAAAAATTAVIGAVHIVIAIIGAILMAALDSYAAGIAGTFALPAGAACCV